MYFKMYFNTIQRNFLFLIMVIILSGGHFRHLHAVQKDCEEVFGKLIKKQRVLTFGNVTEKMQKIDEHFESIVDQNKNKKEELEIIQKILNAFADGSTTYDVSKGLKVSLNEKTKENLKKFYQSFQDGDIEIAISFFKKMGFVSSQSNKEDQAIYDKNKTWKNVVEKYKKLMKYLFKEEDRLVEESYFLTIARSLFHYCFSDKSFHKFKKIVIDDAMQPLIRLIYSTLWWSFAGTGWRIWNKETLKLLKQEADRGKEIIYIAGGSDIYQFIKNGIYNVTILDPQLPTQPKYYADRWEWLIKGYGKDGGVGDELLCKIDDKKQLVLKRKQFKTDESYVAHLSSGAKVPIKHSMTVWGVYEHEKKMGMMGYISRFWKWIVSFFKDPALGYIKFDRRFVEQSDFVMDPKKVYLMSWNELYYIANKGWNVDASKFDKAFTIYCKQMGDIVTKQALENINEVMSIGTTSFIHLGSCST